MVAAILGLQLHIVGQLFQVLNILASCKKIEISWQQGLYDMNVNVWMYSVLLCTGFVSSKLDSVLVYACTSESTSTILQAVPCSVYQCRNVIQTGPLYHLRQTFLCASSRGAIFLKV